MFRIKICGATRSRDIEAIAQAGADSVGINLVPTSPRFVSNTQASELVHIARGLGLRTFAVLMNPTVQRLSEVYDIIAPDAIQLHGQESPELVAGFDTTPIVKALSWSGREEEMQLTRRWNESDAHSRLAWLVDAFAPGIGGGTGRVARWDLLKPRPADFGSMPMLLAGGLTPKNVSQAIFATGCDGVDTASGVESSPGIKDEDLIRAFVVSAKAALN